MKVIIRVIIRVINEAFPKFRTLTDELIMTGCVVEGVVQ